MQTYYIYKYYASISDKKEGFIWDFYLFTKQNNYVFREVLYVYNDVFVKDIQHINKGILNYYLSIPLFL